jgi:hypothetical protein
MSFRIGCLVIAIIFVLPFLDFCIHFRLISYDSMCFDECLILGRMSWLTHGYYQSNEVIKLLSLRVGHLKLGWSISWMNLVCLPV